MTTDEGYRATTIFDPLYIGFAPHRETDILKKVKYLAAGRLMQLW